MSIDINAAYFGIEIMREIDIFLVNLMDVMDRIMEVNKVCKF